MAKSKIVLPNGNKIPALGFGTWLIQDPVLLENSLEAALEAGYRHIDTAFLYGNEHLIGNVLKRWFDQGKLKREDLFITTKLPLNGMRPRQVNHFIQTSLERLQLRYVDLYLLHFPFGTKYVDDNTVLPVTAEGNIDLDFSTDLIGIWQEMEYSVEIGLTKSIGLSNFCEEQVKRIVEFGKIPPATNQVEMHAYFQQRELRALCKQHGVTITAYAPLGSSGRQEFHSTVNATFDDIGLLDDPVVKEIASRLNKTPAQVLIKFMLQQDVVVLCKSTKPERIRENIAVSDFKLSPEDCSLLENLDKGLAGRSFTWTIFPGILRHPEYPFKEIVFASVNKDL